MNQMKIIVTEDCKRAATMETVNDHGDSIATLCCDPATGCAYVRTIGIDEVVDDSVLQIIDLSVNAAYGSYIDSLVEPDDRIVVVGYPDILAIWDAGDDAIIDRLVTEYIDMVGYDDSDWDEWVADNIVYLYTIDDAAYDLWEMIVEDIEDGGRYIVVEE